MPRLERYRRFVAILPGNIFEGPKFICRNWKLMSSDLSAWTMLVSADVRQGGSLGDKPKEPLWNRGAYTLHLFELH